MIFVCESLFCGMLLAQNVFILDFRTAASSFIKKLSHNPTGKLEHLIWPLFVGSKSYNQLLESNLFKGKVIHKFVSNNHF